MDISNVLQYCGASAKIENFYMSQEAFSHIGSHRVIVATTCHIWKWKVWSYRMFFALGPKPSPQFCDMAQAWPVDAVLPPD